MNNNAESNDSIKTLQLNALQLEEKKTATENHTKIATAPSNNRLATFLLPPNQPITMTLPPSETTFFYKIAYEDQNRRLRLLLNQQGYATDHINKTQLPRNLINQTTDYLFRYKNEPAKKLELIKQLLIPLGEYGANEGENISSNHQQAILANWLQRAVLGMPSDTWFLQQIAENKSLLIHENLRKCQFEQLNSQTEFGILSSKAKDYYQEHVLNRIMPTLILQPKTLHEQQRLQQMKLDQPEWGYLHAGAMLLKESSTALNNISLDNIINLGIMLEVLLAEEKVPAQYAHYFKLPAIIHHQLKTINKIDIAKIDEQDMPSIYLNYFNELHQFGQDNPLIQLTNLLQHWQSRPELARQQLKQYDISVDRLDNYLYKNRETEYENRQGKSVLLPNIDAVFKQQNQHIADIFKQTDHILLPQAFHSLSETEQSFIQHAKVEHVIVEYNAQDNMIHSLPPVVSSVAKDGLIIHLPDSIDMLKCTLNGEERIYALEKEQEMGNYKLSRVDRNSGLIFDLIKDHKNTRHNRNFTLKIYSPALLKEADDAPQIAIEKLTTLHSDKLFKKLQEQGYQKTFHQKVDDFFLSLIPFYTCITEAQKGNATESAIAGYFDILSFLPFLGKGLQIGGRFSIAMGEAATGALKTAATKATIAQTLREAGKQFVKEGIPHITKSVPPQTYIRLGVDFMRTANPGFELLASGGIKGINALKNAAIKLKPKINGLTSLAEILDKKVKKISVTSIESLKTTTAYYSGLAKEIPVVNIGQKQGKDIFVQVNTETGDLFGQKYLRDEAGNLELAPILIQERLYQLKAQEIGEKNSIIAARNWLEQSNILLTQSEPEKLKILQELLATRNTNTVIGLSGANFSDMNLTQCFNGKTDLSLAYLTGANLTNANLAGANLSQSNLVGAEMNGSNLSNTLLINANLTNSNLIEANLTKTNLTGAKLPNSRMMEVNLTEADLTNAEINGALMMSANLTDAILNGASFKQAKLYGSNLCRAKLHNALMTEANLHGALLTEVDLTSTNLTKANLIYANLTKANLTSANLEKANLTRANLENAKLSYTNLTGADLTAANFSNTNLENTLLKDLHINNTNFTNTTLNNTFSLALPAKWDETHLNSELNHFENEGSLLTSLGSIDNKYPELKTKLALQLIHSLDHPDINLSQVTLPLLDTLGEAPFIHNLEIKQFVNKLTEHYQNMDLATLLNSAENPTPLANAGKKQTQSLFTTPVAPSKIETAYRPELKKTVLVTKIGQEKGQDIWLLVNAETRIPFGRKYLRDTHGNLELAPVSIQERLYHLRTQGLGGKGSKMAAQNFSDQFAQKRVDLYWDFHRNTFSLQTDKKKLYILKNLLKNRRANTVINLSRHHLNNMDLTQCYNGGTNLSLAHLDRVNLADTNLSGANLSQTQLIHADLTGASLVYSELRGANLTHTNLTNGDLTNASLDGANLTNTNLTGTNLTNVNLINANLSDADLSHATLTELKIHNTNFTGARLNDSFTLSLPKREWTDELLDTHLNHFNNEGSLLTSLASIDNRYSELETKLVLQLIHSLESCHADKLADVTLPLLDTLGKSPFIKNHEINHFVNQLIDNYLKKYSLQLLNNLNTHPTITNTFLDYFDQHPHLMASTELNSAFIQTLIAARTQNIETTNAVLAYNLYEKYLSQPAIWQQLKHDEINGIFGDYEGNPDWSNNDAQNYLLLSPSEPGRTLIASENILLQMLHPNLETKWDNIFLFQDGQCLSSAEYNLSQCYKQHFPLFASSFTYSQHQTTFNKLIEILDLGNHFNAIFLDALKSKTFDIKLVDDAAQQTLSEVFSHVLNFNDHTLKKTNYDNIINIYHLTSSSNREKAEHFLALSAVFTRYSSSTIFGTELNSPLMLRYYAYALMETAHALDPVLMGQDIFSDWKNRLLGTGNAFTCTALLADQMVDYASEYCNDILKKINPPA